MLAGDRKTTNGASEAEKWFLGQLRVFGCGGEITGSLDEMRDVIRVDELSEFLLAPVVRSPCSRRIRSPGTPRWASLVQRHRPALER
ncbi:hypothetical protein ACLOJK_002260 [Asimina triloba]